jgi:hypothetical protein
MTATIDRQRFARAARGPQYQTQAMSNYNVAVGLARIPVSAARLVCDLVYLQADLGNLGVINIGGPDVNINNGIQLDAGRAVVLTPVQLIYNGVAFTYTSLGIGLAPQTQLIASGGGRAQSMLPQVVDLNLVFTVADIAAQNLRVCYFNVVVP